MELYEVSGWVRKSYDACYIMHKCKVSSRAQLMSPDSSG